MDETPCASTAHVTRGEDPPPARYDGVFIQPASRRRTGIAYCLPCAAVMHAAGMFCPDDPDVIADLDAEAVRAGV